MGARGDREGLGGRDRGLGAILTPLARPRLIVVAYRWRYELCVAISMPVILTTSVVYIGPWRTVGWVVTIVGSAAFPAIRRVMIARAWCVITPHRVRTCFAQGWIHNRAGQIPVILRTTAAPFGERLLIWCRAGISADDIYDARELLAAACWAIDADAFRDHRYAHLVYLDIIRNQRWAGRDPGFDPFDPSPEPRNNGPAGQPLAEPPEGDDWPDAA